VRVAIGAIIGKILIGKSYALSEVVLRTLGLLGAFILPLFALADSHAPARLAISTS
jgi:uncharacterized membrane protein (Fun14 family)